MHYIPTPYLEDFFSGEQMNLYLHRGSLHINKKNVAA